MTWIITASYITPTAAVTVLRSRRTAFPDYFVDMVEIGERTGNLNSTLKALSEYYERREQIQKSTRSAITYPAILLGMMLVVAFRAGAADSAMSEIARRTGEEAEDSIEKLIGRIEPALVIVMSVIVGLILLSVMLPLMGVMNGKCEDHIMKQHNNHSADVVVSLTLFCVFASAVLFCSIFVFFYVWFFFVQCSVCFLC